jgi:hypothetical protein
MNIKELPQIIERETAYINNLPLNHVQRVKMYHLMYRGLDYTSDQLFNLHGSTAVTSKGNTVLFGDGIGAIGKSTSSFMTGINSGVYIVDEFSLFDAETGTVFNNPQMPIHIRPDMRRIVGNIGDFEEGFGTCVTMKDLGLRTVNRVGLNALIVPHVVRNTEEVRIEESSHAYENWQIATHAHRIKFTNPEFDRVGAGGDKGGMVMSIDKFIKSRQGDFEVPARLRDLPVYEMYTSKPEEIVELLNNNGI